MRRAVVVILFLFLTAPLFSAAQQTGQDIKPAPTTEDAAPAQPDQAPPSESTWPAPFEPSQEIGADSQISFPTDI